MTDEQINLEEWWEDDISPENLADLPDVETFFHERPVGPGPDPILRSLSKTTAWGDIGTIGLNTTIPEQELKNVLSSTFQKLQNIKTADEWFYVIRRCKNLDIHKYVTASEILIYGSKTNTKISNGYTASPLSELYFHVLRAYARADELDFIAAQKLWTDIHENWLHRVNDYRKPYILSSLYLTSLCVNEWEQSMRYLKQLWSLIKFMDGIKRYAFGIWDEWTTCLLVSWFFMQHSPDFRKVFCADYIAQSDPFSFQRKSIILKNLNNSFISDVISEAYYNKARELNPELPEIEYKEKKIANLRL